MEIFWRELMLTLRGLARRPLFTLISVVTLAVGIGANTAIFTAVRASLLPHLPYADPDRLVLARSTSHGTDRQAVCAQDFDDYREQSRSFESMGAYMYKRFRVAISGGEGLPERAAVLLVSYDLFPTLGVAPALGRQFSAEEGMLGAPDVVMISHGYWKRRFASSPDVLGKTLNILGTPRTIIGVMPATFRFEPDGDVWAPMQTGGFFANKRGMHNWFVIGRLKEGVSSEQAQSELDVISKRLEEAYPETNRGTALALDPIGAVRFEYYGRWMLTLTAAVAALLLIACGNVGGLLLARGTARRPEFAMRTAHGATRGRLMRLVLTESLALSILGGAAGVGLAFWTRGGLAGLLDLERIGVTRLGLDATVLLVALGLSLLTAVLAGIPPALRAAAVEPIEELKGTSRVAGAGKGSRLRGGLVVAQVALSSILLIGSGLLLKNLVGLLGTDPGFDTENLLTAEIELPLPKYNEEAERTRAFTAVLEGVRSMPGVSAAGMISHMPLKDPSGNNAMWVAERPPVDREHAEYGMSRSVLPGYFETMGIPILSGRGIGGADMAGSPPAIVISRKTARALFPGEDALGRQIVVDFGSEAPVSFEVVGIAGDARVNWIGTEPYREFYYAYAQFPWYAALRIGIRSAADPAASAAALRRAVSGVDKEILIEEVMTMGNIIGESLRRQATMGLMVGFFGFTGLFLAALGLYGLLSFHVSLRHHEIGIRMALGSSPGWISRMIIRDGMLLAGVGTGIGLLAAAATVRLLSSLLVGMGPFDPWVFLGAPAFLLATALFACWIPARRAASLEPMTVLRME